MADSPYIFEANAQNFQQLVLETSYQVPVLVDFWADWCQPCKTLMPMLAKLVNEYQGAFILVKVNTDQQQQLAAKFGVRSLPTVKIFKGGQVVDEFMGALPEAEVRKFINRHRMRRTEAYRQQALSLYDAGEIDAALNLMQQVIQHEPDFHEAAVDLASMYLDQNRPEDAEKLLQNIPPEVLSPDTLKQLQAEIKMAKLKAQAGAADTQVLEQKLTQNPDDLATMLELAKLRIAAGDIEAGLELYFTVHKKDNQFQDGAGKKGLFETFDMIGSANPLVKKYRNKVFSLLY